MTPNALLFATDAIQSKVLWRYLAPGGATEIAAFSPEVKNLFVTVGGGVDVVAARTGVRIGAIGIPEGFHATSTACTGKVVAVAWAADDKHNRGHVTFYDVQSLAEIANHEVGYLPDMIVFTPNGKRLLAANEGEPTVDYSFDPEGSITIITANDGWQEASVHEARFNQLNDSRDDLIAAGLHVFGPGKADPAKLATIAEDLEPEYIAVSDDSRIAWITLQENNAIAELDIDKCEIAAIHPLGLKSFRSLNGSGQVVSYSQSTGLDVNDTDGPRIRHWPIWGMYQPDGIAAFKKDGNTYLVTANEGDPRDYYDFLEVVRVGDLAAHNIKVDPRNPARMLTADDQLARLEISRYAGDTDRDGDLDRFVCPGTRSFSIWQATDGGLELVYDSGSDFERIIAEVASQRYNADSSADCAPDVRSPVRGPEPENVALLEVDGRRIAAIGLERTGGAMLYDISRPREAKFLVYLPPHESGGLADRAPEGLLAISADNSPNDKPLLILCNEASGTMTAWELDSRE